METYQKQASDIFLKYIYDYCMGVEYNSRQLRILAERFDTSVLQIRDWSLRYAKETFAEEKYKNIVQKIEQFSINNRMLWDVYIENKNPVLYMLTGKVKYLWENEEEKQLMMKYMYENCVRLEWKSEQLDLLAERIGIEKKELRRLARTYAQKTFTEEEYKNISLHISELTEKDRLNRKLEIMCINPILYQSIGKITNRLWENEDEKKIVLEYIYNYCENNFYYKDKIDEIVEKFGISETRIREYAKEYAIEYLGYSLEEYSDKLLEHGKKRTEDIIEKRRVERLRLNKFNPILKTLINKTTDLLWANDEERTIVLKYIYEYCMKVEWKVKELNKLADELETNRQQIRTWAKTYVKENFSEEEYNRIDKIIDEFTNRNIKLEMPCTNAILQKLTGKVTDLLWENEEDKRLVLKYIYDFCEENNYSKSKMEELSSWSGLSKNRIEAFIEEYITKYMGIDIEEHKEKRTYYNRMKAQDLRESRVIYYPRIYRQILNASTLEEIIKIVSEPGVNVSTLKSSIGDYVTVHHSGDDKIKKILKSKIKMYTDYISQEKMEEKQKQSAERKSKEIEEKLPLAIESITKFINDADCYTIDYFCYKYNFDKKTFEEYVTIIREYQTDLYNIYDKKISDIQKQRYAVLANQVKYIIDGLKHGIDEYDVNRPFDLVDYYGVTKIPLEDILKLAKDIVSSSELNILRKFVNQNISGSKNDPNVIKQIMSERVIIKYEKDKKGQPIPGTEELFGDEEKEKLINYLKEKKVPINLKTYNIVYRRYRNGTLELDPSLKKK